MEFSKETFAADFGAVIELTDHYKHLKGALWPSRPVKRSELSWRILPLAPRAGNKVTREVPQFRENQTAPAPLEQLNSLEINCFQIALNYFLALCIFLATEGVV